jgi:hypothetical protein
VKLRLEEATRKSVGLAVLLVVLGSVLAAGSASAASRGFELENSSGTDIVLQQPQRITEPPRCTTCEQRLIPMAFEGRPADGATLPFRKIHDWELDYYFGAHWHIPQYAAELVYEIPAEQGQPKAIVVYRIYTYILENESTCELFGPHKAVAKYGCSAEGLQLEFTGPGVGAAPQGEEPQTVADFHALPRKERRDFALNFMTTHKVDPCSEGTRPLSHEEALGFLNLVASTVRPGHDAADGGSMAADFPLGGAIRRVLADAGCSSDTAA